jgi:hypothetical protein
MKYWISGAGSAGVVGVEVAAGCDVEVGTMVGLAAGGDGCGVAVGDGGCGVSVADGCNAGVWVVVVTGIMSEVGTDATSELVSGVLASGTTVNASTVKPEPSSVRAKSTSTAGVIISLDLENGAGFALGTNSDRGPNRSDDSGVLFWTEERVPLK